MDILISISRMRLLPCLSVLLLSVAFPSLVHGQTPVDSRRIADAVEHEMKKLLKDPQICSASVGIYLNGQSYTGHFGELKHGTGRPPTDSSLYEIASVTKTMVSFLVAEAVSSGRLSLDDDIRKFLPAPFPTLTFDGNPILIRHLLTHTAGLPPHLPLAYNGVFETLLPDVPERFRTLEDRYGKEDFWKDLRELELTSPPGEHYAYSSAGMEILAYILEQVSGKPLDLQLQEFVFGPAGMEAARLFCAPSDSSRVVQGYWMDNSTLSPHQTAPLWGGGYGVVASLPDMLRYAIWQVDRHDPVLARSHEVLFHDGRTRWVAYGWNAWKDKYGTSFNHHGGTAGMQNWVFIYPDLHLGLVILTNHSGPDTPALLSRATRRIMRRITDR